jgi:mRNA interferase MazF
MTNYKPGQVVLIPFPFTDLTTIKKRPALVISSSAFNRSHDDLIVVAITSKNPFTPQPDEYLLPADEQQAAQLPKPSKVRSGKIVSLDKRLVRKSLGLVSQKALNKIVQLVIQNFS